MTSFTVVFTPAARRDLQGVIDWIADARSAAVAHAYADRIRDFCAGFDVLPDRGTLLASGVRKVGFEGRCTILFTVAGKQVRITRVLYGGRSAPELKEPSP